VRFTLNMAAEVKLRMGGCSRVQLMNKAHMRLSDMTRPRKPKLLLTEWRSIYESGKSRGR
jgi:hypothetical protein